MVVIGLAFVMTGFALLMTGTTGGGIAMVVPGVIFFIAGLAATRKAAPPGDAPGTKPASEEDAGRGG